MPACTKIHEAPPGAGAAGRAAFGPGVARVHGYWAGGAMSYPANRESPLLPAPGGNAI
jgi:hypothetical protein